MTNEQKQVRDWMKAFGQETPEKPTIPSPEVRKLRAKLILEEALETIHALGLFPYVKRTHYEDDMIEDDSLGFWEEPQGRVDLKEIADGCEDLKVVTDGTLVACGLTRISNDTFPVGSDPLFNEVMRSNWSKFWTGDETSDQHLILKSKGLVRKEVAPMRYLVKDKDGKVIKSPSYSPPNLKPIIEEMNK